MMDELEETRRTKDWQSELAELISRKKEEMEVLKKLRDKVISNGYSSIFPDGNDVENSQDESGIEH